MTSTTSNVLSHPKFTPAITESDAALMLHDSYVMHIHTQLCKSCGSGEQFSQLWEVWTHPTKTYSSNLHTLKKVVTSQLKDLEIAYLELPPTHILLCAECVNTFVHPNRTSTIGMASREAWAETLKRKYTPEPKVASGKIEPSLESL